MTLEEIESIFICPACKSKFRRNINYLECQLCFERHQYFPVEGIYALTKKSRKKMWSFLPDKISNFISIILTFAFVCIGYILFRSTSVHQAFEIINRIFTWTDFGTGLAHFNVNIFSTVLILVPILFCIEYFVLRKKSLENIVLKNKMHVVILIHLFLWVMILLFGVSEGSQFIYFQF